MIEIKHKVDCTGCGACVDICNHNAISWMEDSEGFKYPSVNADICTDCGSCNRVCPIIQNGVTNKYNSKTPKTYAAYIKDHDVHFQSTTGGLYSALADEMLTRGGYIGGAVWTDDFGVKSLVSNRPEDLLRIRGSKYFQSDATGMYRQIKELLRKGEKVLVCGTPCQIAGLHNFVGNKDENLITIDFICCSINSPKVFRKYKESLERRYGGKMISYHPKNKEYGGWHNFAFKAEFDNGKVYAANRTEDDFTYCFIGSHVAARPACYECKFKGFPRYSDITIADFWGIENCDSEMDNPIGTSLVLLNSKKGEEYYQTIRTKLVDKEERLEDALVGNSNAVTSIHYPKINRNIFYWAVDKIDFHTLVSITRVEPRLYMIKNKLKRKISKIWN